MSTIPELEAYVPSSPDPLLERAMRIISKNATRKEKHFDSLEELITVVNHWRSMGCVIVLTMGSWDLIHRGHADYIEKAKEEARALYPEADHVLLVVGVDSDELVRERKGPQRPVVSEEERSAMVGHLAPVDAVILEHTLGYLHRRLPHDVRVISSTTGDLKPDDDTAKYSRHLINLPPQAETSTSARIRLLILEGGQEVAERFRRGVEGLLQEIQNVFKP